MKTPRRLLEVAYWPEIRCDVWEYCRNCVTCQKYQPCINNLAGLLQSTPVVDPGYMLGVDLMGPFPRSPRLNEHMLVVVSYCSKWVEMFPLRTAKAHNLANVLTKVIFIRWGTPAYLLSHRGPQFTSQIFKSICRQWGVTQKLTTAYHPQTNITERTNWTLKFMIAAFVKANHRQ